MLGKGSLPCSALFPLQDPSAGQGGWHSRICKSNTAAVQEPEVWHLLKDLEIAAREHNTGSVLEPFAHMVVLNIQHS